MPEKPIKSKNMSLATQISAMLMERWQQIMAANPNIAWADILGGVTGFQMEVVSRFLVDRGFQVEEPDRDPGPKIAVPDASGVVR